MLTSRNEMQWVCSVTSGKTVLADWDRMLHSEHSPIRTVMYRVDLIDIPSFVSVHFSRHKVGVEHFVKSLREDRGGTGVEGRWSPVNHTMILNAQSLMSIARRRLCRQASKETRMTMEAISKSVSMLDDVLFKHLVPMCDYRGGVCHEFRCCGLRPHYSSNVRKES